MRMSEEEFAEYLRNNKRVDGRDFFDPRPLRMEVGIVERAEGSAFVGMGRTWVLCVVRGPMECVPSHLADPEKAVLDVAYRMATFSTEERKSPSPSRREIELSKIIREALEPAIILDEFPRMMIRVYCLVIQADGGTRTASINAASLALAHAGIPMRDLVASVAVGYYEGKILVDLNAIEDEICADVPIAMMPSHNKITLLQADHRFPLARLRDMIEAGRQAINKIYDLQRKTLKEVYEKIARDIGE
ncbi:MAG: exosome complex exonuclease Rrp41 [Candidatus Njordarchaeota archaeon]